jgi:DNA repair photolyase
MQDKDKNSHPIFSVDSYSGGLSFGRWEGKISDDPRDTFFLRHAEHLDGLTSARRRYQLNSKEAAAELEKNLIKLSAKGILGRSEIFLGVGTDPFHPFDGKFDVTMRFLQLFKKYIPGFLHIQTRSPLVVIAMPILRGLAGRVGVTIPIETLHENVNQRFLPGIPKVDERIKATRALRNFGVEVTLQAAPLLPYGDWRHEAGKFAALLSSSADYIHVRPLNDGSREAEKKMRNDPLVKALSQQRLFHWLRPDAAVPLIRALSDISPEKMMIPRRATFEERQLKIFAA